MAAVRRCVEKARTEGMLAWLYDEDRWPSGAAGAGGALHPVAAGGGDFIGGS